MNDWMTDDILVLKALRRKYESLWRKTRLTVHFDMYSESCMDVKTAISNSKSEIIIIIIIIILIIIIIIPLVVLIHFPLDY